MVPWRLRILWANCLYLTRQIHFYVSHIYREGNSLADKLANFGASTSGSIWWLSLPSILFPLYRWDLASMVSYHFRWPSLHIVQASQLQLVHVFYRWVLFGIWDVFVSWCISFVIAPIVCFFGKAWSGPPSFYCTFFFFQ